VASAQVRQVVAIGKTGPAIASLIKRYDPEGKISVNLLGENVTMDEIVQVASKSAHKGDVVLLSTGCASFGMFKDYKDRGDQFNKAVLSLGPAAANTDRKSPAKS